MSELKTKESLSNPAKKGRVNGVHNNKGAAVNETDEASLVEDLETKIRYLATLSAEDVDRVARELLQDFDKANRDPARLFGRPLRPNEKESYRRLNKLLHIEGADPVYKID